MQLNQTNNNAGAVSNNIALFAVQSPTHWLCAYFCGCYDPQPAWEALRDVLGCYPDEGHADREKLETLEGRHGAGMLTLLLYLLDATSLIEHGGNVYGSWLTPLGHDVLALILANPDYEKWDRERE